jgi:hypothetical protein
MPELHDDVTLMPHIPHKATAGDRFLLPRDYEGKPAALRLAVQQRVEQRVHSAAAGFLTRLAHLRAAC